jgi:hypothetical protein
LINVDPDARDIRSNAKEAGEGKFGRPFFCHTRWDDDPATGALWKVASGVGEMSRFSIDCQHWRQQGKARTCLNSTSRNM